MFVSIPVPLMFLPISSTISTSIRSKGMLGIRDPASCRSSISERSKSSGATATIFAVCSYAFSTTAIPNAIGISLRMTRPHAGIILLSPSEPKECARVAPSCLPNPMVIIFIRPLSTGPLKEVCGLTRLTTTMASAPYAIRSISTGMLPSTSPTCTTSIEDRMGAPTEASLIPYPASTSTWPSEVPPPWLPIEGTMKGTAPNFLISSTTVLRITGILAIPRLPAVTATSFPGLIRSPILEPAICLRISPSTSSRRGAWNF